MTLPEQKTKNFKFACVLKYGKFGCNLCQSCFWPDFQKKNCQILDFPEPKPKSGAFLHVTLFLCNYFLDVKYVQSTAQLINALKREAESTSDAESQSKLLSAAKFLADATTKMVEVAKVYSCLLVDIAHSLTLWFLISWCYFHNNNIFLIEYYFSIVVCSIEIISVEDLIYRVVQANLAVSQQNRKHWSRRLRICA